MITSFLPKGRACPPATSGVKCSESPEATSAKSLATSTLPQFQGGDHFVRSNSRANKVAQPHFAGTATVLIEPEDMKHPNEVMDTEGNTCLHYGVRAGRLDMVKKWLKVPDINFRLMDHQKLTAYTACAVTKNKPDTLVIAKLLRDAGAPLQSFPPNFIPGYKTNKPRIHPSDLAKKFGTDEMYHYFLEEEEKELRKIDPTNLLGLFKK